MATDRPLLCPLPSSSSHPFSFSCLPSPHSLSPWERTAQESWRCVYPASRVPFVSEDYLLNIPQFDRAVLEYLDPHFSSTRSGVAMAERFQQKQLRLLGGLPTAKQAGSGAFSSACFDSCPTLSAAYWNVRRLPHKGTLSRRYLCS